MFDIFIKEYISFFTILFFTISFSLLHNKNKELHDYIEEVEQNGKKTDEMVLHIHNEVVDIHESNTNETADILKTFEALYQTTLILTDDIKKIKQLLKNTEENLKRENTRSYKYLQDVNEEMKYDIDETNTKIDNLRNEVIEYFASNENDILKKIHTEIENYLKTPHS